MARARDNRLLSNRSVRPLSRKASGGLAAVASWRMWQFWVTTTARS